MSIATGGIVTEYTNNVNFYRVHKFETTGQLVVNETVSINYLVIAGGGGGGGDGGGGGGAGGLVQGTTTLSPGTYNIIVGAGGAGGIHTGSASSRPLPVGGSNTSFINITALGGGAGGSGQSTLGVLGYPTTGGSGGGGAGETTWAGNAGAIGTSGQGNSGGNAFAATGGGGGGGGGAGGNGLSATSTRGANGGVGLQNDISGVNLFYAGGGGGGGNNNVTIPSAGGLGGGGAGGAAGTTYIGKANGEGQDGSAFTGGGGGGHTYVTGLETNFAGSGGSGVVIVRYEIIPPVAGGTILDVTINDIVYRTHTFTSSGTLSLTQETNMSFLIIGAGGGGTINNFPGSGGPGGAVNLYANRSLVVGNYAVVIGAGGAPFTGLGFGSGQDGGNSTITGTGISLTSNGGDNFGTFQTRTALFNGTTYTGNNGAGGSGSGQNGQALNGGRGSSTGFVVTQAIANAGGTVYAELDQGVYFYGGGGGSGNVGFGGLGHGGNGAGTPTGVQAGSPNSGGGGGGGTNQSNTAAAGGSGLLIAYYPYQENLQEVTPVAATGGDIVTNTIVNGKNYKTHVFESSGTFTVTEGGLVDIMVLGGGGGGGDNGGGGGGAGGVRTGTVNLPEGTYVVTVGSGGAATSVGGTVGGSTGNSSALQPSSLIKAHSFVFDGSGDAINAGISADYAPGTGAFCVEAWIFVNRLKNFGCIMTTRPNNSGYADAWHCGFDQNGAGSLYSNNDQIVFPQGTIKTGVWQHYVCCRNNSNQAAIFVDGFRVSSGTVTNNFTRQQLGIGDFPVTQAESIDGYISNARFVKGDSVYDPTLLTLSVPTAPLNLYTANLSTTAILTAQDLRFIDNSGPPLLLSTANSAFFDGSGDYLTVFGSSSLAVGSENFTFECWVYTGAPPGGGVTNDKLLFGGFSFTPSFVIFLTNGGNFPALWNGTVQQTSSVAVPTNQWTHVAVVRNNGSLTFYVNGVSGGSNSNSTNWATPSTAFIGRSDVDTTRNFSGYISNLRLVKGSAVYTANFTPPTQPLSRISGTSVLTLQNTTFIDNSSNNLTITRFGDVSTATFNPFGNVAKTLTPINNVTVSHFNPFHDFVGPGGGGGASRDGGGRGKSGGSGGGGAGAVAAEEAAAGLGISGLGFNGGMGAVATTNSTGAGGGGAGGPGTNGASQIAGNGGAGFYTNITGIGRFFAGGGGGGITLNGNSGGIGGIGGGGTRNTANPLPDANIESTFEYIADEDQIFTVPEGVATITAKIWGGGGGSSRNVGAGGGGGFASGTIRVNPGDRLLLKVGRGGNGSGNSTNETQLLLDANAKLLGGAGGWSGGGAGGSDEDKAGGAGGGGFSAIFKGPDPLLIAGGGGGGGSGADFGPVIDQSNIASGGTKTSYIDSNTGTEYILHAFTSSGNFETTSSIQVEYLVIAGGGGASGSFGGGGGAGGYRSSVSGELSGANSSAEPVLNLSSGTYPIVVGAGGTGGNAGLTDPRGTNGSNSSFSSITSVGGGTSGSYRNFTTYSLGIAGGSGGGGGSSETSTTYAGGSGTAGQGNAGGFGWGRNGYLGGGGGGAGSVGQDAAANSKAGDGGAGITSSITGTAIARAGGGGGAAYNYQNGTVDGVGRDGGGNGRSNIDSATGLPGTANTGGGGGGGGYISGIGGNGGSGIVIVRYPKFLVSGSGFPPTAGDGGAGGGTVGGSGVRGQGEGSNISGIVPLGGEYYDATLIGPVTSIDGLVGTQGYDALPNSGYLKYILAASPSNITVAVSFTKNGNVISQSAFTLNKQPFNYISSIISILGYANDDHDTLTMIGDGSGILNRTNTDIITSASWDKFRGSATLAQNTNLDTVATYPANTFVGGQSGTVVAFPLTNSEVWIRFGTQTYKVNNFAQQTFSSVEQTTIGTGAPANSHWTISDGVNQFMIGRIGSTNARIFTVNLSTGTLTSEAITLTTAPVYSNGTEQDAFGSKLFAVDGVNTWHAAAQFRYSGSTGWKQTRNIFDTTGTVSVSAGTVSTQTGMDIFGSVDTSGNVWFADWGHDDGGLFGIGNDDRLNIRQTNITYVSLNNFPPPGAASGGSQIAGGISYGSPTIVSGYLQGASGGIVAGGGGGGGYYGGGQGGQYGGGAGGSGFAASTILGVLTSSLLSGSGTNPGNAADASRGTAGEGAASGEITFNSTSDELGRKGKNGRIVLNYTVVYNGRNGESKSGSGGAGGSIGPSRFTPGNGGGGLVAIAYFQGGYVKPPIASGGNEIYYGTISGKTYKFHKFTSSSSLTVSRSGEAEYVIVAGGGGGGEGGGGGGGVISGKLFVTQGQTYTVTVGAGGAGSVDGRIAGTNGSNSVFFIVQSIGGGFGGTVNTAAAVGGSGGGGRRDGGNAGAAGTPGQGFAGGTSPTGAFRGAAGGGGAAQQGLPGFGTGVSTDERGGNGGAGLPFNVTGTEQIIYFGGGGAGAAEGIGGQGLGGLGGGGSGGYGGFYLQTAGRENTGGGGGGRAALNGLNSAGSGGSGVVYIFYPSEIKWQGGRGGQGGPYSGGGGGAGGYTTPALIYQGFDPIDSLETDGVAGLAGKFFNGTWRPTISSGNIGTIPLTADNESSNITGTTGLPSAAHRFGVNSWPFITYSTLGDNYGFIAIGYFKPPVTGTYTFFTSSDDNSGVWIGEIASASTGRTAINAVVNNNLASTSTGQTNTKRNGNIDLTADKWYAIRIVHENGAVGNNLTFSWQGPGIPETTDLTQYFKHPQPIGTWLDFSRSSLVYQRTGNGADGNNVQAGFNHLYAGGGGGGSAQILGGGGGGVGINGTGTSGAGGALEQGGIGGSGGTNGGQGTAGLYGGGGAGITESTFDPLLGNGASGAVKIFWPPDATLLPNAEPAPTVVDLDETNTNLEITYQVNSDTLKITDFTVVDIKSLETDSSTDTIINPFNLGLSIPESFINVAVTRPQIKASSIVSGSTVITSNEVDQEMMIVNNDRNLVATWDNPTYQVIQRVTLENDPRRITVRLLNFVVGVTGEGPLVPTQIQVWF